MSSDTTTRPHGDYAVSSVYVIATTSTATQAALQDACALARQRDTGVTMLVSPQDRRLIQSEPTITGAHAADGRDARRQTALKAALDVAGPYDVAHIAVLDLHDISILTRVVPTSSTLVLGILRGQTDDTDARFAQTLARMGYRVIVVTADGNPQAAT